MTDFPDDCLRGLRSKTFLVEGTSALSGVAFEPDYRTAGQRNDHGLETSINWEDDTTIIAFTLRDHQIAAHGAARLPRRVVDDVNHLSNIVGFRSPGDELPLFYERAPLPYNQYHGNIVFSQRLPKPIVRMIAGHLAMHAEVIHT